MNILSSGRLAARTGDRPRRRPTLSGGRRFRLAASDNAYAERGVQSIDGISSLIPEAKDITTERLRRRGWPDPILYVVRPAYDAGYGRLSTLRFGQPGAMRHAMIA
jgi:hypothetical protein